MAAAPGGPVPKFEALDGEAEAEARLFRLLHTFREKHAVRSSKKQEGEGASRCRQLQRLKLYPELMQVWPPQRFARACILYITCVYLGLSRARAVAGS
jgi:hypothetical protein